MYRMEGAMSYPFNLWFVLPERQAGAYFMLPAGIRIQK